MEVTGEPVSVLSKGEFVVRDKKLVGKKGHGAYIKRAKYKESLLTATASLPL
jgi:dihydropyrimidinase